MIDLVVDRFGDTCSLEGGGGGGGIVHHKLIYGMH